MTTITTIEQHMGRSVALIAAACTVTKRTPRARVLFLRRQLGKLPQTAPVAVALFYLSRGTVPRGLWDMEPAAARKGD